MCFANFMQNWKMKYEHRPNIWDYLASFLDNYYCNSITTKHAYSSFFYITLLILNLYTIPVFFPTGKTETTAFYLLQS